MYQFDILAIQSVLVAVSIEFRESTSKLWPPKCTSPRQIYRRQLSNRFKSDHENPRNSKDEENWRNISAEGFLAPPASHQSPKKLASKQSLCQPWPIFMVCNGIHIWLKHAIFSSFILEHFTRVSSSSTSPSLAESKWRISSSIVNHLALTFSCALKMENNEIGCQLLKHEPSKSAAKLLQVTLVPTTSYLTYTQHSINWHQVSSISFNCLFIFALSFTCWGGSLHGNRFWAESTKVDLWESFLRTSWLFCSSRSGLSFATTIPNIWSWRKLLR